MIAKAITDTLAQGLNFGAPTRHEIALSAEIRKRFPAMELLRFCNSGTEANLLALATARAVTGKDAMLDLQWRLSRLAVLFQPWRIAAQHADAGGDLDLQ